MHRPTTWLALAVVAGVVGSAGYLAWAAQRALTESHTQVFGRLATEWVTQYADQHQGRWPTEWNDLLDCQSPPVFAGQDPAETIETLKQVVTIDFQADPQALARSRVEEFTAIKPRNDRLPVYREYWGVAELLETLARHHGHR